MMGGTKETGNKTIREECDAIKMGHTMVGVGVAKIKKGHTMCFEYCLTVIDVFSTLPLTILHIISLAILLFSSNVCSGIVSLTLSKKPSISNFEKTSCD